MTSDETKNLVTRRAEGIAYTVGAIIVITVVIIAVVLGTTGIFTVGGAIMLGLLGGVVGGAALGALSGWIYYMKHMWYSFPWTAGSE